jgi:hypothetical protein
MSNTIQIKRSSTAASVPTAGQLAVGELAVNLADKKLFTKDASNVVVSLTPDTTPTSGFSFRNRLINSDMRIDQRNAGASVTANGAFPVDRFQVNNVTDGAFSAQQDTSAPAGFVNSVKITTTTADTSLTTTEAFVLTHRIEGTNVSDLAWGTASARAVTLSFWVRSSLTGTFGGALRNSATNRSYPFTYTISTADTWEYKTVTVPGDTTGTWLTTNGTGVILTFGLGCGPDRSGTAGAWNGNNNASATGAVSVIGTSGATFYITGVQLEAGSVATPFERRPFGTELALCQRYYVKLNNDGTGGDVALGTGLQQQTTAAAFTVVYPVTMRAEPTATASNLQVSDMATFGTAFTLGSISPGFNTCRIQGSYVASGAQFRPVILRIEENTSGFLDFSAEL